MQQYKDGGENPYPHKYHVTISIEDFIEEYHDTSEGVVKEDITVSLAGISFFYFLPFSVGFGLLCL